MKTLKLCILLTALCFIDAAAKENKLETAQDNNPYQLEIKDAYIQNMNGTVAVRILFSAKQNVPGHKSVVLVPELTDTVNGFISELPYIQINGRNQHIYYERNSRNKQTEALVVWKKKNKDLTVEYLRSVPYQAWMETSVLRLKTKECNCNISRSENQEYICAFGKQTIQLFPTYRVPQPEEVKRRSESGSAYLCYVVDKTDINPKYMTNPRELEKINKSINIVKNDPYVQIKDMYICGFASPEGDFYHNATLSQKRTESLKELIERSGIIGDINIKAESHGENWDGFVKYLNENENIPQRDILLSILDMNLIDLDAVEKEMKKRAPKGFKYCVDNCFPELRRTDYSINYIVRQVSIEESEKIFETRPLNLSLNEIYLLADKYKDDEIKYKEIMQKTYALYPDDEVANLTMAYLALKYRDTSEAERYLKKVKPCPEKSLNEGIIAYLKGDIPTAEALVSEAASTGLKDALRQQEEFKKLENNNLEK